MKNLSTRLEKLMHEIQQTKRVLRDGRYTNGTYSSSSGNSTLTNLSILEREILELMKEALRAEAYTEAREQLLAKITIAIE